MRLYLDPISANCYKVRLLMAHLGLSCEEIEISVSGERPAELLALNPTGRIPLLVLDDGKAVPESDAILWHLARGTAYLPDDAYEQTRVLGWLLFEQNLHEPNIATRRYWCKYAPEPELREDQLAFWLEKGTETLQVMESWLARNDYFGGSSYTIADIALYAYTHVAEEGGFDLDSCEAIRAWMERVRSQPGHVSM